MPILLLPSGFSKSPVFYPKTKYELICGVVISSLFLAGPNHIIFILHYQAFAWGWWMWKRLCHPTPFFLFLLVADSAFPPPPSLLESLAGTAGYEHRTTFQLRESNRRPICSLPWPSCALVSWTGASFICAPQEKPYWERWGNEREGIWVHEWPQGTELPTTPGACLPQLLKER